jgi:hypothetical protein
VHVKNEKSRAAQADEPKNGAALWARSEQLLARWRAQGTSDERRKT